MVRIDVTLNVTLADTCLVYRENGPASEGRIRSNMRRVAPNGAWVWT